MGVNISVFDCKTGKELAEWDWGRHAGDRELAAYLSAREEIYPPNPPRGYDRENLSRPKLGGGAVREFAKTVEWNNDRWEQLATILYSNPDAYIHVGW